MRQRSDALDPSCLVARIRAAAPGPSAIDRAWARAELDARRRNQRARPVMVGRYRLEALLGSGALGSVYRAHDPRLERAVAIKILHGAVIGPGAGRSCILAREARACARVDHDHVVRVHDVGRHQCLGPDGETQVGWHIVMALAPGRSLVQWIEQTHPTADQVVATMIGAARGLAAIHASGLVHGDVKPDNIVVDDAGHARLLDFGLAIDGRLRAGVDRPNDRDQAVGNSGRALSDQYSWARCFAAALAMVRGAAPSSRVLRVIERSGQEEESARHVDMDAVVAELVPNARGERARVRRGWMLVATALIVAFVAFDLPERAHRWRCHVVARRALEPWYETLRPRLRGTAALARRRYGPTAGALLEVTLDRHFEAWAEAQREICRAVPANAERSPKMVACIERNRVRAMAVAEATCEDPQRLLAFAPALALGLQHPRECRGDFGSNPLDEIPDGGPAVPLARTFATFEAKALRVEAYIAAGEARAAFVAMQSLQAFDLDDLRMQARRLRLAGRVHLMSARYDSANLAFHRAYVAATAARDVDLQLRVAIDRLALVDGELAERDAATRLVELAEALARQTDNRWLQSELALSIGQFHLSASRLEAAEESFERANALREVLLGREHPETARAYWFRASVAYKRREFAAALGWLERAHEIWIREWGPGHPKIAGVRAKMGDIAWRRGQLSAALEHHEQAAMIEARARGPNHPRTWQRQRALAHVLGRRGRNAEAMALLESLLVRARALHGPDHLRVARLLSSLGAAQLRAGQLDAAHRSLSWARQSLERGGESSRPTLPYVLLGLSEWARRSGESDLGLELAQRAAKLWRDMLGGEHPKLSWAYAAVGEAHLARGEHRAAIVALDRGLDLHDERVADPRDLASMHFALARAHGASAGVEHERRASEHGDRARLLYEGMSGSQRQLDRVLAWVAGRRPAP